MTANGEANGPAKPARSGPGKMPDCLGLAGSGDDKYLGEHGPVPRRIGQPLPITIRDMDRPCIELPETARRVTNCADIHDKDPWADQTLIERAVNGLRAEGPRILVARPPAAMHYDDLNRRANSSRLLGWNE